MNHQSFAEYLWLDGSESGPRLRSKSRVLHLPKQPTLKHFDEWYFDGSLTGQADSARPDCLLKPVRVYADPTRGDGNYIVLCEVHDSGGNAHASNYRALLRSAIKAAGEDVAPHLGFKQKYTLQQGRDQCHVCESVSRKPSNIYCGVGCENFLVRDIAEVHAQACLTAGIHLSSMNSQECAGQWEFEIDRRSDEQASDCSALTIADDVWVARYLLVRIGERSDIEVAFDTTPLTAKFSTEFTRDPRCGRTAINALVNILQSASLQQGLAISAPLAKKNGHERPDLSNFSSSTEQSIYIPMQTEAKGCGHIEYCRSVLYTDPYQIGIHLIRGLLEPGTESCNLYDNENVSINS